eukprot:RCo007878
MSSSSLGPFLWWSPPRVAPEREAAVPQTLASSASLSQSGSVSTTLKLSTLSLPATSASAHPVGHARISNLSVTFAAFPVRKYLDRPLRIALSWRGARTLYTRKVRPEVRNGLATASWAEGWELAITPKESSGAVLRLELQAVGLFGTTTTLSFMTIELASLPLDDSLHHTIDFGFGTLTAQIQIRRLANPLLRGGGEGFTA